MVVLSPKQRVVLYNSLAWCEDSFVPTEEEIEDFFGHSDRGLPLRTAGGMKLQCGWSAHYSNEWAWFEGGARGNRPMVPPGAWIDQFFHGEPWMCLPLDWVADYLRGGSSHKGQPQWWIRKLPCYTRLYYFKRWVRNYKTMSKHCPKEWPGIQAHADGVLAWWGLA